MTDTMEDLHELASEKWIVKCTQCDWEGNLDECFRDAKCPECKGEVEWA